MQHLVYVGMGSNLSNECGDSLQIIQQAAVALQQLGAVRLSRLYRSPPMGPQDQPDYANAVAELKTSLEPMALLDQLQQIELQFGRVRKRHWGERTLDLDILLYDEQQLSTARLTIPHIGIVQRDFVLLPLSELAPTVQIAGRTAQAWLQNLQVSASVIE